MKYNYLSTLSLLVLAATSTAYAEDIDLFVGSPPPKSDLPNVLFIIDNTANWNQAFVNEMSALAKTFDALAPEKREDGEDGEPRFNVGIMLATESGSPNNNIKGGYVRAAFRPMTSKNAELYSNLVTSFDKLADKGDGGYSALTMAEAYYYITSETPYSGNYKVKADYDGNTYGTPASTAIYALEPPDPSTKSYGNALGGFGDTRYNGIPSSCAKTFIIYISNGPNQQNDSTDKLAETFLQRAGGSTTQLPLSPTGSQSNPSDEWARFMLSKNIITYTIDVDQSFQGQGPGWTELLKSMARDAGDTSVTPDRYFAVRPEDLADALGGIFDKIQDVNSVFASVSLPLSVNAQGTYLNQVYVGLFRPDIDALPRWEGNLKQYRLGFVKKEGSTEKDLRLLDASDPPKGAVNALTGFVDGCARSYWTPNSLNNYWKFKPQDTCTTVTGSKISDSPDGNVVEKGGQAYATRGLGTAKGADRKLWTCDPGTCTTLISFDTNNTKLKDAIGAADEVEAKKVIDWTIGVDLYDENKNGKMDDVRPSVHGDVVHSRPVALNFGDEKAAKIIVFYGGNDGVFRAINGNRGPVTGEASDINGVPPGGELWNFMPPEFYEHIKRLHDNTVKVSFPNVASGSKPLPKPYGIDGGITGYRTGTDSATIYAAMRRGGRSIYAFDVDLKADGDLFKLKWKAGCPSNFASDGTVSIVGCSSGLEGIGQTWSQPKVINASGYNSPLLIVGGGYDPCEDSDPNTCTSSSKGQEVLVLDATTGKLQKSLPTKRGVIAEITVVPDASGNAMFAYAVDLGGNVYRITIGDEAPKDWQITQIASLGCSTTSACSRNRKFMFAPDVVLNNGTYMLMLGSGDREKPRNYDDPIQNYFFMLQDRPDDADWLTSSCGSESLLCLDSLLEISADTPTVEQLAEKKGWYLNLLPTEQVVTSAITIFGTVTFSTHEPDVPKSGACTSDLGTARVYNINYANAASENGTDFRSEELPGDIGLPPSPVAGAVTLDDGETVPFCIGCRAESPLEGEKPEPPASSAPKQPKSRVYWYIQR